MEGKEPLVHELGAQGLVTRVPAPHGLLIQPHVQAAYLKPHTAKLSPRRV